MLRAEPSATSAVGGSSLAVTIAGTRFPCRDGDVIGRAGTVGMPAARGLATLSRQHLLVEWREDAWQLTLLPTARNQTLLDGELLAREAPRALGVGDHTVEIQGHTVRLHVGFHDDGAADHPPPRPPHPALEQLHRELGQSGSLFELVADHLADLIAIIDQQGRRFWNNAAYFTCLGYPPQDLNASYSMAEVHPEDLPNVQRVFEESMRTLAGQRLEYRMRHRDGHWVHLESQGRVLAPAGSPNKYLVLVARDITERVRAEAQERARIQRLADRAVALAELTRSGAFQQGELEAGCAAVAAAATRHLDCLRARVWRFAEGRATLVGSGQGSPGSTLPAGAGEAWRTALGKERCFVAGGTHPGGGGRDDRLATLPPGATGDFLCVRIGLAGEVLGMLALEHRAGAAVGWSLEDQGFATSLADTLLICLNVHRRTAAFAALQEKERQIAADLAGAAGYVRALLPTPLTSGDIQTDWRLLPCTELGGDGLGHHWLDPDHLAIYLIDSVGHGVGAALLAISVLNILRSGSLPATDFHAPVQVLGALNRTFQMETQNNMFFTVWYGVYDRTSRRVVYATAAHPPAVLLAPGVEPVLLGGEGLMIGGSEDAVYTEAQAAVPPGSRLYVYSDGAFEIMDLDGQPWGFDAFLDRLKQPPEAGVSELDALHEAAQRVHGRPELPDDFSILRLTFH